MNTYTYEQIFIGQHESFKRIIREEDVAAFRGITGDDNPLHTETLYAKTKGYDEKVIYGMLTASYLSTLAGLYLPGKYALIQEVNVYFPRANYVTGEEMTISGNVIEKDDSFRRITLKVRITNNRRETLLRGKMKIGVLQNE